MNNTIFVQIASYRDAELSRTISDCIAKAKHKDNLRFSICWQRDKDNDNSIDQYLEDSRFNIIDIDHRDSKGACWARSLCQSNYNGEKFSLQIDSHHRFVDNWDEKMIGCWNDLNDSMGILTGYPPNYFPYKDESTWNHNPQICNIYNFDNNGIISRPMEFKNWRNFDRSFRALYVSAGFIFGLGQINLTVPYDPYLYFYGEELSMTLRYFTHGYNLYHPNIILTYHYYTRSENPKHWSDHNEWSSYQSNGIDRVMSMIYSNKIDLKQYGLGKTRSVADYEKYSGVNFFKKIIHIDTINGLEPPCSNSTDGWDTETALFNRELSWDFSKIDTCEDPRFWAFIILDQQNLAIHREDIVYTDNREIFNGNIKSKIFKFERYKNRQIPKTLLIWPYSESKQWLTSTRFNINENN
jgi:hypothetical protein